MTHRKSDTSPNDIGEYSCFCSECGCCLAQGLRKATENSQFSTEDGEQLLPPGFLTDGATLKECHLDDLSVGFVADARHFYLGRCELRDVIDSGIRNGCCGPDGNDGPNISCRCGSVVGTEFGDCHMLHFVHLDPDGVRVDHHAA